MIRRISRRGCWRCWAEKPDRSIGRTPRPEDDRLHPQPALIDFGVWRLPVYPASHAITGDLGIYARCSTGVGGLRGWVVGRTGRAQGVACL